MDIRIHPEFLERLSNIDWFSRIFEPDEISTPLDYAYVKSWDEAKPLFRSIKWEWTTNEARNALSEHVGMKFPELFDVRWSKFVTEDVRPWVKTHIDPLTTEVMERHNLGQRFVDSVRWDVMHMILEDVFRDTNPPILFFAELLKFYEAGHFPCGWKGGRWPQGILMVA